MQKCLNATSVYEKISVTKTTACRTMIFSVKKLEIGLYFVKNIGGVKNFYFDTFLMDRITMFKVQKIDVLILKEILRFKCIKPKCMAP